MKKETKFRSELYKEIREKFPGTEVVPNDPSLVQGFLMQLYIFQMVSICCWKENELSTPPNNRTKIIMLMNRLFLKTQCLLILKTKKKS